MKKSVFFFSIGLSAMLSAQNTADLQRNFATQRLENQQKFENFLKNSMHRVPASDSDERARLAGFAGAIPVYNQLDDTRANNSANIPALQSGTLPGLGGTAITGTSLNILVMDGGRIFEKHNEFGAVNGVPVTPRIFDKEGGITSYSAHPTNVGGIIGAIGKGNFNPPFGNGAAKGVLPDVKIDNYAFSTTVNGTNYEKLVTANANISNHSYGINLGWYKANFASSTYPIPGWYWIGNYELNTLDTYSGSYNTQDANFDKIVYNNPNQIVVKSTGNYYGMGPSPSEDAYRWSSAQNKYVLIQPGEPRPAANCSEGYYCIGWGSLAKNIIGVGATDQLTTPNNIYSQPSDVQKASYSSAGPRRDGAVKPDLSAVGSNHLIATYSNGTTYNSYSTASGTSFAAPVVTGVAGALTEVERKLSGNQNFIFKADEMKALLTHTANEAGNPGPDVWFGWGFVDATKAAQLLIAKSTNEATLERNILNTGNTFSKEIYGKAGSPLKVSISWIDPASVPFTTDEELQNNHSSQLINDLDLRIIDTTNNTVYFPWKLDITNPMANATKGDNTVDNVEQVLLENPIPGRKYRIEVSAKGTLKNDVGNPAPTNFALVASGYQNDATLGTSSASEKIISVYPTLTHDYVTILIPEGAKSIEIYDMAGKKVLSSSAKSYQIIDVQQLPAGVYIINIQTSHSKISKKIIKK